jgi:hypothetical protein
MLLLQQLLLLKRLNISVISINNMLHKPTCRAPIGHRTPISLPQACAESVQGEAGNGSGSGALSKDGSTTLRSAQEQLGRLQEALPGGLQHDSISAEQEQLITQHIAGVEAYLNAGVSNSSIGS